MFSRKCAGGASHKKTALQGGGRLIAEVICVPEASGQKSTVTADACVVEFGLPAEQSFRRCVVDLKSGEDKPVKRVETFSFALPAVEGNDIFCVKLLDAIATSNNTVQENQESTQPLFQDAVFQKNILGSVDVPLHSIVCCGEAGDYLQWTSRWI